MYILLIPLRYFNFTDGYGWPRGALICSKKVLITEFSIKMEDLLQSQTNFSFSGTESAKSVLVVDLLSDLAYRVTNNLYIYIYIHIYIYKYIYIYIHMCRFCSFRCLTNRCTRLFYSAKSLCCGTLYELHSYHMSPGGWEKVGNILRSCSDHRVFFCCDTDQM